VVDFVEQSPHSLAALRANAELLGAGPEAVIHRADAMRFAGDLPAHAYDVAFADPPYDLGLATALAELWLKTPFAEILGVEHRVNEKLPGDGDRRRYGGTVITFYRVEG
jgi:16S rRNA (guanine966-N2)-methyltransferase